MKWHDTMWYEMIWTDLKSCDMIWYDMMWGDQKMGDYPKHLVGLPFLGSTLRVKAGQDIWCTNLVFKTFGSQNSISKDVLLRQPFSSKIGYPNPIL